MFFKNISQWVSSWIFVVPKKLRYHMKLLGIQNFNCWCTGVMMNYHSKQCTMGNPSNLPYICIVWSLQIGNLMISLYFAAIFILIPFYFLKPPGGGYQPKWVCILPPVEDSTSTWVFPKMGVPQNGWFIMENPIKMDDLGVPPFLETPIWWLNQPIWKIMGPSKFDQFPEVNIRNGRNHHLEQVGNS